MTRMTAVTRPSTLLRRLLLALITGLVCCFTLTLAQAAVFACPTPSGGTIFQDRPCPMPNTTRSEATLSKSKLPAGMHASWFDRPEFAVGTAVCDDEGCQCGELRRGHESGLNFAVADSLYLDGNWHRYEAAIAQLRSTGTGPAQARELEARVSDAACDVLISQETLKRYSAVALRSMRTKARNAEDRGSDYPELCDINTPTDSSEDAPSDGIDLASFDMASFTVIDEQACERYTDLIRYRSMINDAQALRMPRTGVINTTAEDPEQW